MKLRSARLKNPFLNEIFEKITFFQPGQKLRANLRSLNATELCGLRNTGHFRLSHSGLLTLFYDNMEFRQSKEGYFECVDGGCNAIIHLLCLDGDVRINSENRDRDFAHRHCQIPARPTIKDMADEITILKDLRMQKESDKNHGSTAKKRPKRHRKSMIKCLKSKTGYDTVAEMVEAGEIQVAKWQRRKKLKRKNKGHLYIWLLRSDFNEIQLLPTDEQVVAYIAKAKYIGIDTSGQFQRFSGHMQTAYSPFDLFLRESLQNDTHLTCIFFKQPSNLFKVYETVCVYMFRDMPSSEILNINGSVVLSENIANYDTDAFYAVLVWLMHEAVTNPIQTMHTTSKHADVVRKRVAKEQVKPLAEYNIFITKLVDHLKKNGGEIACEKCLFGLNQFQTAVYMDGLQKTGAIRIVGKKIKWGAMVDEKEASNEGNADEEVDQWWNLDDADAEEENVNASGEANESFSSEDDDFENNNAPARAKTGGASTGKKNPGKTYSLYNCHAHIYMFCLNFVICYSVVVKKQTAPKAPTAPKASKAKNKNKSKPMDEKNDDNKRSKLGCTKKSVSLLQKFMFKMKMPIETNLN